MSASLDDLKRRTHVWQIIVRSAFSMDRFGTDTAWHSCFMMSLPMYAEESQPAFPRPDGDAIKAGFRCRPLDLGCEYRIGIERADVDLRLPGAELQVGFELGDFACEPYLDGWDRCEAALCEEDVDSVLRGMIHHPRVHLHVHEPCLPHEVRIGTGLQEPLVFLFQLRYQLNLSDEARRRELQRLKAVFTLDALRGHRKIKPSRLFGLDRSQRS